MSVDESNRGRAIIRFLPNSFEDEGSAKGKAFIPQYQYSINKNGMYYTERLPSILGLGCPAYEKFGELYKSDKELAKTVRRRCYWVCNILVKDDKTNKDNNGKVFLYECPSTIFDIIKKEFDGESDAFAAEENVTSCNVSNLFKGKDFALIAKLKSDKAVQFRNYGDSKFATEQTPVLPKDKDIEKLSEHLYSLSEWFEYKSYE